MGLAFQDARDALFADPNLPVLDGAYLPRTGDPIACRVILLRHDEDVQALQTGAMVLTIKATLRTSDIPTRPRDVDHLIADGVRYAIRHVLGDALGLTWTVTLEKVTA